MKNEATINPIFELYQHHKSNINTSRELLFARLNKINPKIKDQVEKLYLDKKIKNQLPYLGELYPWVISELFDFQDQNKVYEVSQDWMALYYYTIFTDDVIDSKEKNFIGNEMISLTALMKEGLFRLYKAVINTPYEEEFEEAINSVLNSGKEEEEIKGEITTGQEKADYSEKKNDLIKLCTYALVSKCVNESDKIEKIIEFTTKLQLSFQYLDDIADLKEDLKDQNYTVILNALLKEVSVENIKEDNLISLLIEKEVLSAFVTNLLYLFEEIHLMLRENKKNSSTEYFEYILKNLVCLREYLKEINLDSFKENEHYKLHTIHEAEKRIGIIASST